MSRRAGSPRLVSIAWLQSAMIFALIAAAPSCGKKSSEAPARAAAAKPNEASNASAKAGSDSSPDVAESGADAGTEPKVTGTKTSVAPAEDDNAPRGPATVEEARRALDLTEFPLPAGAETGGQVAIAHIGYKTPAPNVKSAFDYVRKTFTEMGWTELAETHISEESAYGNFAGKGFHATVMASKDSEMAGRFSVSISNRGNLNLAKLPMLSGAKLHHSSPTSISYFTELSPDEAADAVGKLLTDAGWITYGHNIGARNYKQNAVLLTASVVASPAFENKTTVSYLSAQMSADLPAPPKAVDVTYTDHLSPPKQLIFESAAGRDEIYQFYRGTLAKEGWQPTSEKPITDEYKAFMIFRNQAKDLLELETRNPENGTIDGTLKHQSAAEVAEIERQIELNRPRIQAELKKKREEEEAKTAKREQDRKDKEAAEKARRRVVVAPPADAKDLKFEADEIKFGVPRGKARTAAEAIARQLRDAGWKDEKPPTAKDAGSYNFKKDDQSIHIIYLDPGVIPPEVRVSGFRVDFERADDAEK